MSNVKENVNNIEEEVETKAPNLMISFVDGAKKGMDIAIHSLIPNIALE